jgi:hypothetical protein
MLLGLLISRGQALNLPGSASPSFGLLVAYYELCFCLKRRTLLGKLAVLGQASLPAGGNLAWSRV